MARLDALTAGPRLDLVLDLRPVSFIDCAWLGVLCRALKRTRIRHGRLRLVTDSTRFLRLLRCTGLAGGCGIHPRWPADLISAPVTQSVSAPADRAPTAPASTAAARRP
uniref:STAS domain-containing protein n=1 Tax=Streptomyces sp. SS7 TaxID=3108485 RepID=UPI00403FE7E6